MADRRLNVVLCWHMHQPFYREGPDGDFRLPWVYLHGLKDYTDMAAHLERHPSVHAVVDFAPVLLEQIDIYVAELRAWLETGGRLSDPLLNLLAGVAPIPEKDQDRRQLIDDCRRCNPRTMVEPYPAFQRLMNWVEESDGPEFTDPNRIPPAYLSEQYFVDLLVWYHLAWTGSFLREDATIRRLIDKQSAYSHADRRDLLEVIYSALGGIIPRYRALAESGQIELAMTPYSHPIIPLLNDFANMHCALPDAPGPNAERYPGGTDRSRWHMQRGIELFEQHFGRRPLGVWLSEGGVSVDALAVLEEFGISWTASGEGVWKNCCLRPSNKVQVTDTRPGEARRSLFKPYCYQDGQTRLFFRDDGLSDLIGFEYQHWQARDAAANFSGHLENIAEFLGDEADQYVVSIILDGENAWEHYPDNGHDFLDAFYNKLSNHPGYRLTTFSEVAASLAPNRFKQLCPGSWIYGSFSTWIGEKDKNSAWEALVEAKLVYDRVLAAHTLSEEERERACAQLAICESSDWFWWFGDYNPADSVRDFDQMFRIQLKILYQLLKQPAPERLEHPFSSGNQHHSQAGAMRRAG